VSLGLFFCRLFFFEGNFVLVALRTFAALVGNERKGQLLRFLLERTNPTPFLLLCRRPTLPLFRLRSKKSRYPAPSASSFVERGKAKKALNNLVAVF